MSEGNAARTLCKPEKIVRNKVGVQKTSAVVLLLFSIKTQERPITNLEPLYGRYSQDVVN